MSRIGILECGRNRDVWLKEYGGFADWIPPFLTRVDGTLTFEVFAAYEGALPGRVDVCDAWLLTGSPASVYENRSWQRTLTDFVAEASKFRPTIGICYGHQHLHAALGGAVEKGSQWGVGIQRYALTEMPDWLPATIARDSAEGFRLIALHQDYVSQSAPGSRTLAGSAECPVGVTTIGDNVLTFQAHPEMAAALASHIYDFHGEAIGHERAAEAKRGLSGSRDDLLAARWIVAFINDRLGFSPG